MTIKSYLFDKILMIFLNILGAFFLYLYLRVVQNSMATAGLIVLIWFIVYSIVLTVNYIRRKRFFDEIEATITGLDQTYLIQDLIQSSWRLEDRLYHDIMSRCNRAMIEQIASLQQEQEEYREYLESWVHEAKLPITGMRLACRDQINVKRMELYLSEMDHMVEQALFYARSDQVYQDFQVKKINLKKMLTTIISKNKYLFIQNNMNLQVLFEDAYVYSDRKWIEFIVVQLVINAIKYKKDGYAVITFSVEESPQNTRLKIKDNGIGIPANELSRIFEKGFTGTNGRERENTTGIGLYLCRKLCQKLEIRIAAESVLGEYTELSLIFPQNSYLSKM